MVEFVKNVHMNAKHALIESTNANLVLLIACILFLAMENAYQIVVIQIIMMYIIKLAKIVIIHVFNVLVRPSINAQSVKQ